MANFSSDVCVYSLPGTFSVRDSDFTIPNPRLFLALGRTKSEGVFFLFLLVIDNIWRFSSSEVATADKQLACKKFVMLPYSVFLIEKQIIYFGEKCKFFCICMSKWPL